MTTQAPFIKSTSAFTFKPRVRRLGPGRYLVESASRRGVGHPVTVDHCPCKGFSYRGTCRHVALVQAIEPRMQAWYSQGVTSTSRPATTAPACILVSSTGTSGLAALHECFG